MKCDGDTGEEKKKKRKGKSSSSTKTKYQMESALLLDAVVTDGTAVLKLLTGEDETLLIRRDALLIMNLRLHAIDAVARLHLKGDSLASQSLHENLHSCPNPKSEVRSQKSVDVELNGSEEKKKWKKKKFTESSTCIPEKYVFF